MLASRGLLWSILVCKIRIVTWCVCTLRGIAVEEEGQRAEEQLLHDDAEAVNVARLAAVARVVLALSQQLGRYPQLV